MPSPSSSTQQPYGVKRKKPPTFQHLPVQRAKKLKQSWVDVQKIKSKWKTQKRKEGLPASRVQLMREAEADEEATRESGSEAKEESGEESEEESGKEEEPLREAATSSKARAQPQKAGSQKKTDEQPSLRDLQRMAYSRSSLHTYKSNSLHRRKDQIDSGGRGGRPGARGGRGGQRGRERGRGQPDMGLRMKAMLEKIKQDFT
ncbi:hypothetical protein C8Q74DRAFT_1227952 [Fomes fomentarius]|nr:hypothetical protein C8Q74DRAFT_1227952 [Fomes fomentarius]